MICSEVTRRGTFFRSGKGTINIKGRNGLAQLVSEQRNYWLLRDIWIVMSTHFTAAVFKNKSIRQMGRSLACGIQPPL